MGRVVCRGQASIVDIRLRRKHTYCFSDRCLGLTDVALEQKKILIFFSFSLSLLLIEPGRWWGWVWVGLGMGGAGRGWGWTEEL